MLYCKLIYLFIFFYIILQSLNTVMKIKFKKIWFNKILFIIYIKKLLKFIP